MKSEVDVLVIGAGQAGLAMGYYLKKSSLSFLLIEANNRIGDSWRQRYDSLVLFTPASYSELPGLRFPGSPTHYPTKDEVADYLESYANEFFIPVHLHTQVKELEKTPHGFRTITNQGEYLSKSVVIATGPFQKPFIPSLSGSLSNEIIQLHSSAYRNPGQLSNGSVLIVGAGNSGAQIAVELSKEREVFLSVGHSMKFLPLEVFKKSIFWWFDKLWILDKTIDSKTGAWISKQPDPIFGLELKTLIKNEEVNIKPKTVSATGKDIMFEDGSHIRPDNIIWATGFHPDYRWINIPDILNPKEKPIHQRGVSPAAGLYFLGLPWQYRRGSALLEGVGKDATHLLKVLSKTSQLN